MRWKIDQQEKKLDDLFSHFERVEDDELRAYLSKFLCVRASGFVESCFKNLIYEYIYGSCPEAVEKYLSNKIKSVTNLNYHKLIGTLNAFDSEWGDQLADLINDEQRAALNSVVSNRNNISHGESDNISYEVMKNYYKSIKEVVGHMKKVIRK